MSIQSVAEASPATEDGQVIADMAAAVLASVARIHADGLAAVTALAEAPAPLRAELPPVAEAPVAVEEPAMVEEPAGAGQPQAHEAELTGAELVEAELVEAELVEAELVEADEVEAEPVEAADDEPVVRITEPVGIAPQPRGRHFSEAETTELPAQRVA